MTLLSNSEAFRTTLGGSFILLRLGIVAPTYARPAFKNVKSGIWFPRPVYSGG